MHDSMYCSVSPNLPYRTPLFLTRLRWLYLDSDDLVLYEGLWYCHCDLSHAMRDWGWKRFSTLVKAPRQATKHAQTIKDWRKDGRTDKLQDKRPMALSIYICRMTPPPPRILAFSYIHIHDAIFSPCIIQVACVLYMLLNCWWGKKRPTWKLF